jgi:anti-anti-sigma factor
MEPRTESKTGGASSGERLVSTFSRSDNAVVVALSGELDFYTSQHLAHNLDTIKKAGVREIVFDLRDLAYLDSTGIAAIVRCFREVRAANGRIACTVPRSSFLKKILEKTKIASLLPFADTVEAAVAIVQNRAQKSGG